MDPTIRIQAVDQEEVQEDQGRIPVQAEAAPAVLP